MEFVLQALSGGRPAVTAALRSSSRTLYDSVERRSSFVLDWEPRCWTNSRNDGVSRLARCSREGVWIVVPGPPSSVQPSEFVAFIQSLGEFLLKVDTASRLKLDAVALHIYDNRTALCPFATQHLSVAIRGCDAAQCLADSAEAIVSWDVSLKITDVHFCGVTGLPLALNVTRLTLTSCHIDAVCLRCITDFKSLTSFELYSCRLFSLTITDSDTFCRRLAELPSLRSVSWDLQNDLLDMGAGHFGTAPSLTFLSLRYCRNVTDEGLSLIIRNPNLKTLFIDDMPHITDEGLCHISTHQRLQSLTLNRLDVTDLGLHVLARLKTLTYLRVWNVPRITTDGFRVIGELPLLEALVIDSKWSDAHSFFREEVSLIYT